MEFEIVLYLIATPYCGNFKTIEELNKHKTS